MSLLVILVEIELEPNAAAAFAPLIEANAAASLREEPGCHGFDVLHDPQAPGAVVLYEVYRDAAAFDAHLRTRHFASFRDGAAKLIRSQKVRRLTPAGSHGHAV